MKRLTGLNTAYLLKAGHDLLFQEIREWKSDLEFYKNEMNFFRKLLDKSFLRMTANPVFDRLELISGELENSFFPKCISLLKKVYAHEESLGKLEEELLNKSDELIIEEHSEIKNDVYEFTVAMKAFKTELFGVSEEIFHSAKVIDNAYKEGNIAL